MQRTVPELIAAKRDGHALAPDEIRGMIRAYTEGRLPDYQMAAFAMSVFFRGMTDEETVALTLAMRDSGRVLDLSDVPGVKVDKHSTGGVGDKVSLCLAPLVAACGVPVPMISGRGLGHTGGTLDKLEAIPGFDVRLEGPRFVSLVRDVGCALGGQTADLAPADRKLYGLRDVTATVESIPLIVASILSKKLAEGIDGLVLDVKVGSGAFMKTMAQAEALSRALVRVAQGAGKKCVALLTSMEQPLGLAVGNALETIEAFDVLHGRGPSDLVACTLALGAEMLVMGGVAETTEQAHARLATAIRDGSGARKAREIVAAQGGDPRAVDDPGVFARASLERTLVAQEDGWIASIDTHAVGAAGVTLGAGRTRSDEPVDPAVGFVFLRKTGERVRKGEPLVRLLGNDPVRTDAAEERLRAAIRVGPSPVVVPPLVLGRVAS